jgi:glycosyltransferase involved in cell wall biosynthesis
MSVSVVIPCHNAAEYIDACLESVVAQSASAWEAVVVDDGSSDDSAAIVERRAAADARITLVRLGGEGGGAAAARNAGIRAGRQPLVAFLDADDRWLPHRLARQMAFLRDRPEAALVAARARVVDAAGAALEEDRRRDDAGDRRVTVEDLLFRSNPVATSSVLVRRSAIDAVGPFREGYRIIEDLDLWIRVARHGEVWRLGEALVEYRVHGANSSRDRLTSALQKIRMWEREILPDPELRERYGRRLRRRLQRMHWSAARALARAGRDAEARDHWRRAIALDAWTPLAWRAASKLGWSRLTARERALTS